MPQLVPFYFVNLLTFGMLTMTFLLYMVSTKLLPNIVKLLLTRSMMVNL
ncbi:ATP synthase protein 8 (mitochondrion) [[Candida] jaroonii]|uniref:ATP synthase protein 8 n=1 Tax=[Candida] jaroonii TaxID=467808 RepID=A0ACA9YGM6_9ASCO|nr:ATP synthase protein 8 [[Candida] jaroonii]